MSGKRVRAGKWALALGGAVAAACGGTAHADTINIGLASNYAVLYQGSGNNTLQVTNVTVNGNIGVGGVGKATDSGPSTVNGRIDFKAANTGQFSNNNAANVITGGVNYGVGAVDSALSTVNGLSQSIFGIAGTGVAINGIQTLNASAGRLRRDQLQQQRRLGHADDQRQRAGPGSDQP